MKSKTITLLFFLSFLFMLYPAFTTNVSGAIGYYSYGFESTTATHQVSEAQSGFFTSWNDSNDDNCVDTTQAFEGTKSYQVSQDGGGASNAAFNSTLTNIYLQNISFYIYFLSGDAQNGLNCINIYLFDPNNIKLCQLMFESDTSALHLDFIYLDHNDVEQIIELSVLDDLWHKVYINFTTNDTMDIGIRENDGTTSEVTGVQPYTVVDNPIWDNLRYYISGAYDSNEYWIDLFNVTVTTEAYSGGESIYDLSDYSSYCEGETMSSYNVPNSRYVENKFNVKLTAQINAVDLYIDVDQLNQVNNLTTGYYLYINNIGVGNPDIIFQDSPNIYIMRWYDTNVNLNDDYPVFEFQSNSYVNYAGTNYYWFGLGVETSGGYFKYHNNINYLEGLYTGTQSNFGLFMCFYYSGAEAEVPSYAEEDNIYPTTQNNNDIYQELETIVFGYTISTNSPVTYIQLIKDGTRILTQGYGGNGKIANPYSGTCSYYPNENSNGSYNIKLVRNAINITWYNFTIVNRSNPIDYNAAINTYPLPSENGETFTIAYLYNKTYFSNSAATIVYSKQNFIESGNYHTVKSFIYDSGNTTFSITNDNQYINQYWFFLCILEDGVLYPIADCEHFVGNYYTNEIHTDKKEYILADHQSYPYKVAKVNIYGGHTFLNGDVYVLINDGTKLNYYVGKANRIDLEYDVFSTGYYKVELIRYTSNGTYSVLDSTYFTVELGVSPDRVIPAITDPTVKAFLTMIMVLSFTFSPILIAGGFKYPIGQIPSMVYALSCTLGCCFSVMLGWADIWLPFTIIVIGIIVTVLLYLKKQGG